MPSAPSFVFDRDPAKARTNRMKHGVGFAEGMAVFGDPLAPSLFDDGSVGEERCVTLGLGGERVALPRRAHLGGF